VLTHGSAAKRGPQHLVVPHKDALERIYCRTVTRRLLLVLARGLYPIVVVVVLSASVVTKLLILAGFANCASG
jgi:hypothetical protein